MRRRGFACGAVALAFMLVGFLSGCQAQPSRRPLRTTPVAEGAGTTESVRRQLEGNWALVSLTVFDANGSPQKVDAAGRLTYDAFGNLELAGKLADPKAVAAQATALDFKGRAVIDPGGQRIVLADVSGRGDPTALPKEVGPDKARYYSFEGDTLTLETRDGSRVLARTVWRKAQ